MIPEILSTGITLEHDDARPGTWWTTVTFNTATECSGHIASNRSKELEYAIDNAKEMAEMMRIRFTGTRYASQRLPALYVDTTKRVDLLPSDWAAQVERQCERLGWEFIYQEHLEKTQ